MPFLQDIIVNIASGSARLAQAAFRPLVMDTDTAEIIEIVATDPTDVISAGWTTGDDAYKMASQMFAQSPSPSEITVYRKATVTDWDAAHTTLIGRSTPANDFWSSCISSRLVADLNTVGTWAGSNERFFFGCVDDETAGNGRNVDREAYLISDSPAEFPECAWVGETIPQQPGSLTFKWKHPTGITAAGSTKAQLQTIRTNNTQAPTNQAGVIYVNEGICTSGVYIDDVWGRDWIKAEMQTEITLLMLNNPKIALDNVGIARVEAKMREVMDRAGQARIIAASTTKAEQANSDDNIYQYKVSVPLRENIPTADLTARKLTGATFSYITAGAIHEVPINGVVNIS